MKNKKNIYINEVEIKSILIRVKNLRTQSNLSKKKNERIDQLIKTFLRLIAIKYDNPKITKKKVKLKNKLTERIIKLSEMTCASEKVYENFGKIVILTIKNILRKPQFNGYTYGDDFYSDASYKILKYLKNFDHTKISTISGQEVKAFAYLTQIINNSIIFVINHHRKINDNISAEIKRQKLITNININKTSFYNDTLYRDDFKESKIEIIKEFGVEDFFNKFKEFINKDFSKVGKITYTIPYEVKENIDTLYLKEQLKRKCKHIKLIEKVEV